VKKGVKMREEEQKGEKTRARLDGQEGLRKGKKKGHCLGVSIPDPCLGSRAVITRAGWGMFFTL
jgi:hypothetical protein